MAALIAGFLVALGLGLAFGLGAPWLVLVGVAVFWLVGAVASGRSASPAAPARRTQRTELLGPGGPDDPDRGR